jgi:hypothetical protein
MTSMDRFAEAERTASRPARALSVAWLRETTTWFAASVAGMIVVFAGLAVDAYRHNHGAGEESLLSLGNPGHMVAAIGLVITSLASLAGLSVAALRGVTTPEGAVRRFVPVTAAWVVLATLAVASVTYIAASGVTVGHSDGASAVAGAHVHAADAGATDAGGVAKALTQQGIISSDQPDPATVPGALTQGSNGDANGHQHDHGKQPTFVQIETLSAEKVLPLFPANTVSAADLPLLKQQIEQVHQVALQFPTIDAAKAAGYVNTTSDVPFMGEHFLNYDLVKEGVFDPAHPQGLLFSKIGPNGEEQLVGVWFLLLPGINGVTRDADPAGFASNLDLWHAHVGLCLVALSGASEGETKESCTAKGGSYTADLRWMMHVWVAPNQENPDGVFAYLNNDLWAKQQEAAKLAGASTGTVR